MKVAKLDCPDCGAPMKFHPTSRYGPFYGCSTFPKCRATHGAHPNGRPLGIPADKATKEVRIRAHAAFDRLWKGGGMSRGAAYRALQALMDMSEEEAHIGRFTKAQCERLIELLNERQEAIE